MCNGSVSDGNSQVSGNGGGSGTYETPDAIR